LLPMPIRITCLTSARTALDAKSPAHENNRDFQASWGFE
jgi:hypothetical protein